MSWSLHIAVKCFFVGRTDSEIILCLVVLCLMFWIISLKLSFWSRFLFFFGSMYFSLVNNFALSRSVSWLVSITSKSSTILASFSPFNSYISATRFPLTKKVSKSYLVLGFFPISFYSFLLFINLSKHFLLSFRRFHSASFSSYSFLSLFSSIIYAGSFLTTCDSNQSSSSIVLLFSAYWPE